ncbi:hypothetical protein [Heyndrickxia coagulans]|uniref:Uncharacterized protein n=4 Tax=Bacillaceae TaxID=186817 RepID=A0A150K6F5_HEYCO|nr:hypothetical protein [Heyndrickxia coagulans]AEH52748.1 hypothetical protein BCO26_0689 [Heyndrickxia coagulans 2-6]KYC64921.1 hypothetical protein B4098_0595 [Heyndrickxia coagulans]
MSLALLASPMISIHSYAQTPDQIESIQENQSAEEIFKEDKNTNSEILESGNAESGIKVDGKVLKPDKLVVAGAITDESNDNVVPAEVKQGTQLLEMKKLSDGSYEGSYVSVAEITVASKATYTNTFSDSEKTPGGKVVLTSYYHTQYYKGVKHYDMNFLKVDFSSTGGTLSNRYVQYGQTGYSFYKKSGGFVTQSAKKNISSNSETKVDVPDSWVPIYKGTCGSNAHATVKYKGKKYSLSAIANFLNNF